MGMDLYNAKCEYFYCNLLTWRKVLLLAYDFGWSPQGTIFEPDVPWDEMDYISNSRQEVTQEDALEIAKALDDALEKLRFPATEPLDDDFDFEEFLLNRNFENLERASGELKSDVFKDRLELHFWCHFREMLTAFAKYCRRGGFLIC